jgi:hypothetical protein
MMMSLELQCLILTSTRLIMKILLKKVKGSIQNLISKNLKKNYNSLSKFIINLARSFLSIIITC